MSATTNATSTTWDSQVIRDALSELIADLGQRLRADGAKQPTIEHAKRDRAETLKLAEPLRDCIRASLPSSATEFIDAAVTADFLIKDVNASSGYVLTPDWAYPEPADWTNARGKQYAAFKGVLDFLSSLTPDAATLSRPTRTTMATRLAPAATQQAPATRAAAMADAAALRAAQRKLDDQSKEIANLRGQIARELKDQAKQMAALKEAMNRPATTPAIQATPANYAEFQKSSPVTEEWDFKKCDLVVDALFCHATRLAGVMRDAGATRFSNDPLRTIRPASFALMRHLRPELATEDPERLTGEGATVSLGRAYAFLLRQRLEEWQDFVLMLDSGYPETDFSTLGDGKRKRSDQLGETGSPSKQQKAPIAISVDRQADTDIHAVLKGNEVNEAAPQFTGSLLTRLTPVIVPRSAGVLGGLDMRVRPFMSVLEDQEAHWRWDVDGKAKLQIDGKCKSFDEWDSGFIDIIGEAKGAAKEQLKTFRQWMRLHSELFGFKRMLEFWELLLQKLGKGDVTLEQHRFTPVWEEFRARKLVESNINLYVPSAARYGSTAESTPRPWHTDVDKEKPTRDQQPPRGGDKSKKRKTDDGGDGKKAARKGICYKFNGVNGCKVADCPFQHICRVCKQSGHSKQECTAKQDG